MFYAQSRRVPTPEEHYGALQAALMEVAERSFFRYAEPCDLDRFGELSVAQGTAGWWHASIGFSGAFAGRVDLRLPEALARDLVAGFIGLTLDEVRAEHVGDMVGEFANMVCGTWLTRSCGTRRFALRAPLVARTGAFNGFVRSGTGVAMAVNDLPVDVQLIFE